MLSHDLKKRTSISIIEQQLGNNAEGGGGGGVGGAGSSSSTSSHNASGGAAARVSLSPLFTFTFPGPVLPGLVTVGRFSFPSRPDEESEEGGTTTSSSVWFSSPPSTTTSNTVTTPPTTHPVVVQAGADGGAASWWEREESDDNDGGSGSTGFPYGIAVGSTDGRVFLFSHTLAPDPKRVKHISTDHNDDDDGRGETCGSSSSRYRLATFTVSHPCTALVAGPEVVGGGGTPSTRMEDEGTGWGGTGHHASTTEPLGIPTTTTTPSSFSSGVGGGEESGKKEMEADRFLFPLSLCRYCGWRPSPREEEREEAIAAEGGEGVEEVGEEGGDHKKKKVKRHQHKKEEVENLLLLGGREGLLGYHVGARQVQFWKKWEEEIHALLYGRGITKTSSKTFTTTPKTAAAAAVASPGMTLVGSPSRIKGVDEGGNEVEKSLPAHWRGETSSAPLHDGAGSVESQRITAVAVLPWMLLDKMVASFGSTTTTTTAEGDSSTIWKEGKTWKEEDGLFAMVVGTENGWIRVIRWPSEVVATMVEEDRVVALVPQWESHRCYHSLSFGASFATGSSGSGSGGSCGSSLSSLSGGLMRTTTTTTTIHDEWGEGWMAAVSRRFAYRLRNGIIGVYQGMERIWRWTPSVRAPLGARVPEVSPPTTTATMTTTGVSSSPTVVAMTFWDVDDDGIEELVLGWSHGLVEVRTLSAPPPPPFLSSPRNSPLMASSMCSTTGGPPPPPLPVSSFTASSRKGHMPPHNTCGEVVCSESYPSPAAALLTMEYYPFTVGPPQGQEEEEGRSGGPLAEHRFSEAKRCMLWIITTEGRVHAMELPSAQRAAVWEKKMCWMLMDLVKEKKALGLQLQKLQEEIHIASVAEKAERSALKVKQQAKGEGEEKKDPPPTPPVPVAEKENTDNKDTGGKKERNKSETAVTFVSSPLPSTASRMLQLGTRVFPDLYRPEQVRIEFFLFPPAEAMAAGARIQCAVLHCDPPLSQGKCGPPHFLSCTTRNGGISLPATRGGGVEVEEDEEEEDEEVSEEDLCGQGRGTLSDAREEGWWCFMDPTAAEEEQEDEVVKQVSSDPPGGVGMGSATRSSSVPSLICSFPFTVSQPTRVHGTVQVSDGRHATLAHAMEVNTKIPPLLRYCYVELAMARWGGPFFWKDDDDPIHDDEADYDPERGQKAPTELEMWSGGGNTDAGERFSPGIRRFLLQQCYAEAVPEQTRGDGSTRNRTALRQPLSHPRHGLPHRSGGGGGSSEEMDEGGEDGVARGKDDGAWETGAPQEEAEEWDEYGYPTRRPRTDTVVLPPYPTSSPPVTSSVSKKNAKSKPPPLLRLAPSCTREKHVELQFQEDLCVKKIEEVIREVFGIPLGIPLDPRERRRLYYEQVSQRAGASAARKDEEHTEEVEVVEEDYSFWIQVPLLYTPSMELVVLEARQPSSHTGWRTISISVVAPSITTTATPEEEAEAKESGGWTGGNANRPTGGGWESSASTAYPGSSYPRTEEEERSIFSMTRFSPLTRCADVLAALYAHLPGGFVEEDGEEKKTTAVVVTTPPHPRDVPLSTTTTDRPETLAPPTRSTVVPRTRFRHFHNEAATLRWWLQRMAARNEVSIALMESMADSMASLRQLLGLAEETRALGQLSAMKLVYTDVLEGNRDVMAEHQKRKNNVEEGKRTVREVNEWIRQAARLRRLPEERKAFVNACQTALRENDFGRLIDMVTKGE